MMQDGLGTENIAARAAFAQLSNRLTYAQSAGFLQFDETL